MKTALVNNKGNISKKIIISTEEELMEYSKLAESQILDRLSDRLKEGKETNDQGDQFWKLVDMISAKEGISKIEAMATIAPKKIDGMRRALAVSNLVVNENGSYTLWDDKEMEILDESYLDSPIRSFVQINKSKILVIENQSKISPHVRDFAHSLDQNFSLITHLRHAEKGETEEFLKEAIQKGCNTLICETTTLNEAQIQEFALLFQILPPFTVFIFTYVDLRQKITELVGKEICDKLYEKHQINIKEIY